MVRHSVSLVSLISAAMLFAMPSSAAAGEADSPNDQTIELISNSGPTHCSAFLRSRAFPNNPTVRFDMEQVRLKNWKKFWEPYVQATDIQVKSTDTSLEFVIVGELDKSNFKPGEEGHAIPIPYKMRLTFTAEKYRVKVRGEMLELGADRQLAGFSPCMSSEGMRAENLPAFEAAHQAFAFYKDSGFGWISDGLRYQSESHPGATPGPWSGIEGPWIGMYPIARYAPDSDRSLAAPVVCWASADGSYMIAAASRNAYQAGLRWTPCLHSDANCLDDGKSFETVIYIMPADLEMFRTMYAEDFPDEGPELRVPASALWPNAKGALLDGFEGPGLDEWRVEGGSLSPYKPLESWAWVNHNNGPSLTEGVTEGHGSAIVEIPAGQGEVVLMRTVKIDQATGPVSHVAIDAINRTDENSTEKTVRIALSVSQGERQIAHQSFDVLDRSNRRLLLPLDYVVLDGDLTIELRFQRPASPQRVVLDNLRSFPAKAGT
jgi:hypothetical protein